MVIEIDVWLIIKSPATYTYILCYLVLICLQSINHIKQNSYTDLTTQKSQVFIWRQKRETSNTS